MTAISWRDAIVWLNAYSEMARLTPVYHSNEDHSAPINNTAGSIDKPYVNWEDKWQYAAGCFDGSVHTDPAFAADHRAVTEHFPEYSDHEIIPIMNSLHLTEDLVTLLACHGIYAVAMSDDTMDLLNAKEPQQ